MHSRWNCCKLKRRNQTKVSEPLCEGESVEDLGVKDEISDEESDLIGPHLLKEDKALTGGKEAKVWAVDIGDGN